jgi:hypothetical protein
MRQKRWVDALYRWGAKASWKDRRRVGRTYQPRGKWGGEMVDVLYRWRAKASWKDKRRVGRTYQPRGKRSGERVDGVRSTDRRWSRWLRRVGRLRQGMVVTGVAVLRGFANTAGALEWAARGGEEKEGAFE